MLTFNAGFGDYANAAGTSGSSYTGSAIQPLKQAGADLDIVAFQAYNAGSAFDPAQGLKAYQQYFQVCTDIYTAASARASWHCGHTLPTLTFPYNGGTCSTVAAGEKLGW